MSFLNPEEKPSIFNDKFKIVRKLGEGFTSVVYLASKLDDSGAKVAIKVIKNLYAEN